MPALLTSAVTRPSCRSTVFEQAHDLRLGRDVGGQRNGMPSDFPDIAHDGIGGFAVLQVVSRKRRSRARLPASQSPHRCHGCHP
jgi:hypothetical protein